MEVQIMARRMTDIDATGMTETDAAAFVDALRRLNGYEAKFRRLMVGAQLDQPTDWFIVSVPHPKVADANKAWRWWKAGQWHTRIDDRRSYRGGTYQSAAHELGYLEVMPVDPIAGPERS
jgi:hypothetical protein